MRISDWSSDVCSSDLGARGRLDGGAGSAPAAMALGAAAGGPHRHAEGGGALALFQAARMGGEPAAPCPPFRVAATRCGGRSEEHTSELQSLMRISYAVF